MVVPDLDMSQPWLCGFEGPREAKELLHIPQAIFDGFHQYIIFKEFRGHLDQRTGIE